MYGMERLQNTISFDEKMNTLANIQRRKLLVSLLDHNPQDDEPVVINASESDAEAMDRLIKKTRPLAETGPVRPHRVESRHQRTVQRGEIRRN